MSEDLRHLWTPESTLRLRDTSGRRNSKIERCISCGDLFDAKADPESALCPACSGVGRFRNNEYRPDITDMARCKDPEGEVRCLLCAKLFAAIGNVFHDQICSECRATMKDSAKLVCAKCNITICRLAPKILDSGFIIRPNAVLHSDTCNICTPGLSTSNVIEIDLWQKSQRPRKTISTRTNPSGSRPR